MKFLLIILMAVLLGGCTVYTYEGHCSYVPPQRVVYVHEPVYAPPLNTRERYLLRQHHRQWSFYPQHAHFSRIPARPGGRRYR